MKVRRLRKEPAHLEITAFINLIVVLVPFLLSTAVFTRLAVLDRRFAAAAGRWPELMESVLARSVHRSRRLAFHMALSHLTRVDVRLLAVFWYMADRWGRVGPEGVVLQLRLTHQTLAQLVGAQRPSVTTALGQLAAQGKLIRRDVSNWLLHGRPPDELSTVRELVDGAGGAPAR